MGDGGPLNPQGAVTDSDAGGAALSAKKINVISSLQRDVANVLYDGLTDYFNHPDGTFYRSEYGTGCAQVQIGPVAALPVRFRELGGGIESWPQKLKAWNDMVDQAFPAEELSEAFPAEECPFATKLKLFAKSEGSLF